MTLAVRGWSPVIMIGRMPACFARATASFASTRGGSIMPIRPANTRSCSTRSSGCAACSTNASRVSHRPATPSVRSAWPASCSFVSSMAARRSGVSGRRSSPTSSRVHRVSRTSGAPFVKTIPRSSCRPSRCIVLISLRSEEKGTSATRGSRSSSASELSPAFRAATSSAPSVGSPSTVHRPSVCWSEALFARSAAASACSSSMRSAPSSGRPPSACTVPCGA